jgi:hypothetical protein
MIYYVLKSFYLFKFETGFIMHTKKLGVIPSSKKITYILKFKHKLGSLLFLVSPHMFAKGAIGSEALST